MKDYISADDIGRALEGKRTGDGRWMCRCPAHDDRKPSLSVRQSGDTVLVHCHTGCPQESVIRALQSLGVWPKREREPLTPQKRQDHAYLREAVTRARYWAVAAIEMAEYALEELPVWAPTERMDHTKLIQEAKNPATRTRRYLAEMDNDPKMTWALVAAGMKAEKRWQRRAAEMLVGVIRAA